jgi:Zn-finger nucleic acid-binding protein
MELAESHRYFRCHHCGSYGFLNTVETEGVRVVGRLPEGLSCPVCATPLVHALLDDHPIDFCETCRGVLLPRKTFAQVVNTRRAWAGTPPEPVPLNTTDLNRVLNCPKCGRRFDTYPTYGPGNVVIDSCVTCDLVWLDFGEMRQIVDAPGRDRGSQRVPRLDDDYIREGPPRDDEDDDPVRSYRSGDVLGLLIDTWFGR